jgi:hypothetical protein
MFLACGLILFSPLTPSLPSFFLLCKPTKFEPTYLNFLDAARKIRRVIMLSLESHSDRLGVVAIKELPRSTNEENQTCSKYEE